MIVQTNTLKSVAQANTISLSKRKENKEVILYLQGLMPFCITSPGYF